MKGRQAAAQTKRPLFAGGLTAVAVTATALSAPVWVILAGGAAVIALLAGRRRFFCAVIAAVFLVIGVGYRHLYVRPAAGLDGVSDTVTGRVVAVPANGQMYTVQVTHSQRLRAGSRLMLYWYEDERPKAGSTVTADVHLYALEKGQTHYAAQGAVACAFPAGDEGGRITRQSGDELSAWFSRGRATLSAAVRRTLPLEESGVLAALCFGERAYVTDGVTAAFRGSGLSHLLVVSGLHLSMAAGMILLLLRPLGRRLSVALTLPTVWLFALLVGATASVLRAVIMCTVWLVGTLLFCRADGRNSLGLAAMVLLAANPCTLWNVGFQLSFAATFGVLTLARRLTPRYDDVKSPDSPWWLALWQTVRRTVTSGAAVCVSALLFTLPIAAYHYGGLPLTSVISNVLAVPAAAPTLLLGWLGAVCGLVPFLGWLSRGVLLLAGGLARYMLWVARLCAPAWAWLTVMRGWQWLLLCGVCLLATVGILRRVPRRRLATGLSAVTVLAVAVGIPLTVMPARVTVVPSDDEGGFILRQGTHCALIVTDAAEIEEIVYATAPFEPDVIFVGAGDAADIPQLTAFSRATVVTADEEWRDNRGGDTGLCPVGGTVELWSDCRLTVVSAAWWRLDMGGDGLWIGTDPAAPAPVADEMCVYVGGTPDEESARSYTAVCSESWLRRHRPALTGQETILTEEPLTFIPYRGEWSVSLWL